MDEILELIGDEKRKRGKIAWLGFFCEFY